MIPVTQIFLFLFLCLTIFLNEPLFASSNRSSLPNKVVLLISSSGVNPEDYLSLSADVTRSFYNEFAADFEIEVINQANQYQLFKALNDELNLGVFWVSHSNSRENIAGTDFDRKISDSNGVDVSDIFMTSHPRLKWIGVIGCRSFAIFQKLTQENSFQITIPVLYDISFHLKALVFGNPLPPAGSLVIAANSTLALSTIEARRNFKAAKKYFIKKTPHDFQKAPQSFPTFSLRIKRVPKDSGSKSIVAAQIRLNDHLLYIFPESQREDEVELKIPLALIEHQSKIDFVVDSGRTVTPNSSRPPHLGEYLFESAELNLKWHLLEVNGQPLGINMNIYSASR